MLKMSRLAPTPDVHPAPTNPLVLLAHPLAPVAPGSKTRTCSRRTHLRKAGAVLALVLPVLAAFLWDTLPKAGFHPARASHLMDLAPGTTTLSLRAHQEARKDLRVCLSSHSSSSDIHLACLRTPWVLRQRTDQFRLVLVPVQTSRADRLLLRCLQSPTYTAKVPVRLRLQLVPSLQQRRSR